MLARLSIGDEACVRKTFFIHIITFALNSTPDEYCKMIYIGKIAQVLRAFNLKNITAVYERCFKR